MVVFMAMKVLAVY